MLATLDTKGPEASYLVETLRGLGLSPLLVDLGLLGPPTVAPDIPREEVARRAGASLEALLQRPQEEALQAMGRGAGLVLAELLAQGRLHGALGIGGNRGTAVACIAMQALPLGFPKVMLSTVASGDIRPFVRARDIAFLFSVGDLLGGPNPVSRSALSQAAAAVAGMAMWGQALYFEPGRPAVAITALGNTHPTVTRCLEALRALGWECVPFHASGACGTAMEELLRQGRFQGALDITPHELVGEVLGHDIYRPVEPGRLTSAGARGVPQVVCTGGLDYYCFGPPETVPEALRGRRVYMHNPFNANVALTPEEMALLGRVVAERLNASRGPAALVVPLKGWSIYGREGGPLWNPEGISAFRREVRARLKGTVRLVELEAHINDPLVADTCVGLLRDMMGAGGKEERYVETTGPGSP